MALNSFFTGLSGLSAQSSAINVIGDNLANLNTIGFKSSNVRFADLVAGGTTSASGNPQQVTKRALGEVVEILGTDKSAIRDHDHPPQTEPPIHIGEHILKRGLLRLIAREYVVGDGETVGHHHAHNHLNLARPALFRMAVSTQLALR